MGKIYTNYDEYLQDAYEEYMDRYANSNCKKYNLKLKRI